MGYKHLTREQRYTIEALLQTPMSLREIGEVIGVSTGTVSREMVAFHPVCLRSSKHVCENVLTPFCALRRAPARGSAQKPGKVIFEQC